MASKNSYKSFKEYPGPVKRQGPFSLDLSGMFTSLEAAKTYAQTDPAAYVGQILTVAIEKSGGVTQLYYFGIKDEAGTLMQIMTLVDSQNLISSLGKVMTYKGSLFIDVADNAASIHDTYMHANISALLTANGGITPKSGDVYNINMDNSLKPRSLHLVNSLAVETDWNNMSDSTTLYFNGCNEEDGKYYVDLVIADALAEVFNPANNCSNLFAAYGGGTSDGAMKYCFFNIKHWTSTTIDNQEYKVLKIELIDAFSSQDEYVKYLIDNPSVLSPDPVNYPNITAIVTPKEVYDYIQEKTSSGANLQQAEFTYSMQINNGDNIVYNGYSWDVLSGVVDMSIYATKDELLSTTSAASSIYRQE